MKRLFLVCFVALLTTFETRHALASSLEKSTNDNVAYVRGMHKSNNTKIISIPLIPHHIRYPNATVSDDIHLRRRRLFRNHSFTQVNQLYQGYGTHYVDLWIGTPVPQRQTLIVDTGSSVTAFPCRHCKGNCGKGHHTDSYYRESKSRTFEVVECDECKIGTCHGHDNACMVEAQYAEGSLWRGFEASDVVYSGGPHDGSVHEGNARNSFRLHFACQTRLKGFFKQQLADGILGMEMSSKSLWRQMYEEGVLEENCFSLCLSRHPSADRNGTSAGIMTLGGIDTKLHATNMVYANQLNDRGWFVVRLKRLFLRTHGGESVKVPIKDEPYAKYLQVKVAENDLNSGSIVLDSGTTDTFLSSQLYQAFNEAWKSLMGRPYNNRDHGYTNEELLTLPTLLFQLEAYDKDVGDLDTVGLVGKLDRRRPTDVLVSFPPTHYMQYNPKNGKYASRLYFSAKRGGVLGANFMMQHDVHFDAHRGRIGFAESTCQYEDA